MFDSLLTIYIVDRPIWESGAVRFPVLLTQPLSVATKVGGSGAQVNA